MTRRFRYQISITIDDSIEISEESELAAMRRIVRDVPGPITLDMLPDGVRKHVQEMLANPVPDINSITLDELFEG